MMVKSNTAAVSSADFREMIECRRTPGTCVLDTLYRPRSRGVTNEHEIEAKIICNGKDYTFNTHADSDLLTHWDDDDDDVRLEAKRRALSAIMRDNRISFRAAMAGLNV